MNVRSPIKWFGGKGIFLKKILPLIPKHNTYLEVFGGGASLLFAKEPSNIEVYNDLDEGLVNFFRVLRDPEKFGRFYHYAIFTPYARSEYDYCLRTWKEEQDDVVRAYKWFVIARMSFSGRFGHGWSNCISSSGRNGVSRSCAGWLSILEMMPEIHERIQGVQIECDDWKNILERYDKEDVFAYLDPPYIPDTRLGGAYYCEMSADDHNSLVKTLLNYSGMVILSGYAHGIYKPLEDKGWIRKDFETVCHASKEEEKPIRVESIWMNKAAVKSKKFDGFDFETIDEKIDLDEEIANGDIEE